MSLDPKLNFWTSLRVFSTAVVLACSVFTSDIGFARIVGAPQSLTAVAQPNGKVVLSWEQSDNAVSIEYRYWPVGVGNTSISHGITGVLAGGSGSVKKGTLTDSNARRLYHGVSYNIEIRGVNSAGSGTWSVTTRFVANNLARPLAKLTDTKGKSIAGNSLTATIGDSDNNPIKYSVSDFIGQTGDVVTVTITSSDTKILTVSPATLIFRNGDKSLKDVTVTGLSGSSSRRIPIRHNVEVRTNANSPRPHMTAANGGEMLVTVVGNALPTRATGLSATPGTNSVTLSWDSKLSETITKWQYQLRTGEAAYGSWTDIAGSDETTASYQVAGLVAGVSYGFRVRAVNEVGEGWESEERYTSIGPPCKIKLANTEFTGFDMFSNITIPANCGYISRVEYQYKDDFSNWSSWIPIENSNFLSSSSERETDLDISLIFSGSRHQYFLRARAVRNDLPGAASDTASGPLGLPRWPEGFTVKIGNRSAKLTWKKRPAADEVSGYFYYYTPERTFDYLDYDEDRNRGAIFVPGANTTSVRITGLTNGQTYRFYLAAAVRSRAGKQIFGFWDPIYETATPEVVPPKPAGVRAVPGSIGSITLFWNNPQVSQITKYQYKQKKSDGEYPQNWIDIAGSDASTTKLNINGLDPNTLYTYKIRAVSTLADGSTFYGEESDEISTQTLGVPVCKLSIRDPVHGTQSIRFKIGIPANCGQITNIQIHATDITGQVILNWDTVPDGPFNFPNSDSVTTPTQTFSYEFSRFSQLGTLLRTGGGTYLIVRVRAQIGLTVGQASSEVRFRVGSPEPPAGLKGVAGRASATISWDVPDDPSTYGYWYRYKVGENGEYGSATYHPLLNGTSVTVTGLDNDKLHTFAVQAQGGSKSPDVMVEVTPSAVPVKPVGFEAVAGQGQVTLRWENPNDPTITKWQYQQKEGAGSYGDWTDIADSVASTVSHVLTGLENGTVYKYKIRAVESDTYGAESDEVILTPGDPCKISLRRLRGGADRFDFRLAVPANCGSISDVQRQVRLANQNWGDVNWQAVDADGPVAIAPSAVEVLPSARYTVRQRQGNYFVWVRVRAVNGTGIGTASDEVRLRIGAPERPTGVKANVNDGTVALTWNDMPGQDITLWQYQYKPHGGAYGDWVSVDSSVGSKVTVTGLENGAAYTFRVRAVGSDIGPVSDEVTVTPVPPADKPEGLVAVAAETSVTLNWALAENDTITGWQYEIWQGNDQSEALIITIPGSSRATTSHAVIGLNRNILYSFRLRALNASGPRRLF